MNDGLKPVGCEGDKMVKIGTVKSASFEQGQYNPRGPIVTKFGERYVAETKVVIGNQSGDKEYRASYWGKTAEFAVSQANKEVARLTALKGKQVSFDVKDSSYTNNKGQRVEKFDAIDIKPVDEGDNPSPAVLDALVAEQKVLTEVPVEKVGVKEYESKGVHVSESSISNKNIVVPLNDYLKLYELATQIKNFMDNEVNKVILPELEKFRERVKVEGAEFKVPQVEVVVPEVVPTEEFSEQDKEDELRVGDVTE